MFKIIHISDFHLETDSPSSDKLNLVKALANDLHQYVDNNTIIVFTGDLLNKGGKDFKSSTIEAFKLFEKVLFDEIITENPTIKNKIFVVPGNHDIVRDKIDSVSETGLAKILASEKDVNEFISANRIKSKHIEQLEDYKLWEHGYYSTYQNASLSNFDNSFIVELSGKKIGISCFNSSWLCRKKDDDKENLIIGKTQILNSLNHIKDCEFKVAITHHPVEFLKDFDRDAVKIELFKNYNILLTGHVHELSSTYTQDLYGDIFISIANSTIADESRDAKYYNGYNIIEFVPNEKVIVTYRKYLPNHEKFVANTEIGNDTAIKEFPILKNENLQNFYNLSSIVERINENHIEKLNNHIIVSSNSTNAHCTIDNLFVAPRIYNCAENSFKEEDTKEYTIESILESNANFLIYGQKESGKTILLDKLFIEAAKRFNHFNKIPVILKFNDFKEKELYKVIREFVGLGNQEFIKLLTESKVIVFIDEINFSQRSVPQISELESFISKFPNVQIVTTNTQSIEGIMPIDYLEHNAVLQFNVGFIQSLNSSEIKSLILKWFKGQDIDFQENMEKLIKNFNDFGLPKTPLSVTMFLWIFEKQEKKPINNSVLVELFVENLLEKTNIENIYSETLSFKNKKRLLAFIAKYMKDNGKSEHDYYVDYVDLLGYINDYLKTRFTGKPQKVLDDFINRGILCYEDVNQVKFKSGFFFHYFLSVYMEIDNEFKLEVFTDENYLNYIEEIGYYTGLKGDDFKVLEFTQKKLSEAFDEFNKSLLENPSKIDEVLEIRNKSNTIAFQLKSNNYQNKPSEKQIESMYDETLSNVPVQNSIPDKTANKYSTKKNFDRVLKLASSVLKNSEDVDNFELKTNSYKNILISSISFLMLYRDSLIGYYAKHNKKPQNFPKNIDFNLFVHVLPLIHQIMIYEWLGSQKLRPVVIDKIKKDDLELNMSQFEKFISVFLYADIKGSEYPQIIENFVKKTGFNYTKDLSFLKVMSYYHLRSKNQELDNFYLRLMADIKVSLGDLDKKGKSEFILNMEEKKKKGN